MFVLLARGQDIIALSVVCFHILPWFKQQHLSEGMGLNVAVAHLNFTLTYIN